MEAWVGVWIVALNPRIFLEQLKLDFLDFGDALRSDNGFSELQLAEFAFKLIAAGDVAGDGCFGHWWCWLTGRK